MLDRKHFKCVQTLMCMHPLPWTADDWKSCLHDFHCPGPNWVRDNLVKANNDINMSRCHFPNHLNWIIMQLQDDSRAVIGNFVVKTQHCLVVCGIPVLAAACIVLDSGKVKPCDGLVGYHMSFNPRRFKNAQRPALNGLHQKGPHGILWWCCLRAAQGADLHQHLGQLEDSITKVFHEALSGANLATGTPSPQAKPSRRAKQPVQLALFLEHPLVRTGHCVTVITLLAACQTHAILQNSAVDASLFFSGWLCCFNFFIWPNTFSKHFFSEVGAISSELFVQPVQLWWFGLVQAHLLVQALPFLRVQFIHFGSNHFALVYHGPEESWSLSARAAASFRTGVCPLAGSKWGSAFDTVFSVWRLHVRNKCILWHIIYTCWLQRDTVLLHLLPQTPHDLRAVSLFFFLEPIAREYTEQYKCLAMRCLLSCYDILYLLHIIIHGLLCGTESMWIQVSKSI